MRQRESDELAVKNRQVDGFDGFDGFDRSQWVVGEFAIIKELREIEIYRPNAVRANDLKDRTIVELRVGNTHDFGNLDHGLDNTGPRATDESRAFASGRSERVA